MPVIWNTDPARSLIRVSFVGRVTPDQLDVFHGELDRARPEIPGDTPFLLNLAGFDSSGGPKHMLALYEARRRLARRPRRAAWVVPTLAGQLMARYFIATADIDGLFSEDRVLIFESVPAAEAWLAAEAEAGAAAATRAPLRAADPRAPGRTARSAARGAAGGAGPRSA